MKFDIYCHFIPPVAKELIFEKQQAITEIRNNAALHDLDERFRIMDKYPDVMQILTVPGATPDDLAEPGGAPDLAKRINDDLAELVFRYTDRFVGAAAVVPISDIDATLDEIDRAVNELKLRGILLRIPINGKPMDREEFFPVYAKMCEHNLPIWIHPHQSPNVPDYADETESKYIIWHMWGLIYETTVTMTRLVFSGVMDRFPDLKIITHHCGAMVPYFSERIVNHYNQSEMINRSDFRVGLRETPVDYFRRFYTDTAIIGNTPALMCAHDFYGTDQMLFGSDAPFDALRGGYGTPRTIEAIEAMDIPDTDKFKIFEDNARKLLRLPA